MTDNIKPSDIDIDIDGVDFSDVFGLEEDTKKVSFETDTKDTTDVEAKPSKSVKKQEVVSDFYNHKKRSNVLQRLKDNDLKNKYYALQLEDNTKIQQLKENRRLLSEKLEKDPDFRKQYIETEEKKRLGKDILKQVEPLDD